MGTFFYGFKLISLCSLFYKNKIDEQPIYTYKTKIQTSQITSLKSNKETDFHSTYVFAHIEGHRYFFKKNWTSKILKYFMKKIVFVD